MTRPLDPVDKILVDRFQRDFPLIPAPFAEVGASVGVPETETIRRFRRLADDGIITRIGAVVAPNALGASTLCAIKVPPHELARVAAIVSADRHVNHNYERENPLNLWFVVTAPGEAELQKTLLSLTRSTGYQVRDLRLQKAFHLDLGFPLDAAGDAGRWAHCEPDLAEIGDGDQALLAAIEDGIVLSSRPYLEAAARIGRREADVLDRLSRLVVARVIRRFGVVVRHRAVGIRANAMAVWDVPDDKVSELGWRLAREPGVTLCYSRRRADDWRYNLYCMVHARTRGGATSVVGRLDAIAGGDAHDRAILFSRHCFKQTGARFSRERNAA